MGEKKEFQEVLGFEENFIEFHVDPLHGPIGVTKEETKLIDNNYFQRLKYIRQLGFVHNFYHSATHTRYEHSLGVLHTTWAMFKRIFSNSKIEAHNYFDTEVVLKELADSKIIRAVRIAGLCHDLGHGPFSHTFETISEELSPKARNHDRITYEIIKENKIEIDDEIHNLVLSIVSPKETSLDDERYEKFQFFLHDLVAGDIGSDRIDYLLRDTYMTGLGHRFGLNHLLDALTAIYDPNKNRLYVSVEESEKDAVLYFLTTRFYHFQLLANYKENVKLEAEFKSNFTRYIREKRNKEEISKVIEEFQRKTDDEVKLALGSYTGPKLKLLAKWSMNEIAIPKARFFVYRFSYNKDVRRLYANSIRKYVKNALGSSSNLIFSFNVQKGRIPVIPVTLPSYRRIRPPRKKGEKTRIEYLNSLLHEFSPLLFGLARTYLDNTIITVYGKNEDTDLRDILERSPKFLIHDSIVKETLVECSREIEQEDEFFVGCDRIDFLILFVEALRETKTMMIDKAGFNGNLFRFWYLQYLINKTQKLIFSEGAKLPYEFNEQSYFYNPGRGDEEFLFHKTLFNDIFLLELFEILEIRPFNDERTPVENEIHYYPSYKFTFNLSNLAKITSEYRKYKSYNRMLAKIIDSLIEIKDI